MDASSSDVEWVEGSGKKQCDRRPSATVSSVIDDVARSRVSSELFEGCR